MTTTRIPLVAQITVTIVSQAVTAAYGSAGDLVNYSAACSSVLLRNPGEVWPIEFKVGSGAWQRLEIYNTTLLGISLDTTTIRVRKALANSGSGLVQLDIKGLASTYLAGDDAVDLGGEGGGAAAFTDLTDTPVYLVETFPTGGIASSGFSLDCYADDEYNPPDAGGQLQQTVNVGDNRGQSMLGLTADSTEESAYFRIEVTVTADLATVEMRKSAGTPFVMTNFPTTDPEVANALWINNGVLTLSAG